jgi:hypothetical protein
MRIVELILDETEEYSGIEAISIVENVKKSRNKTSRDRL